MLYNRVNSRVQIADEDVVISNDPVIMDHGSMMTLLEDHSIYSMSHLCDLVVRRKGPTQETIHHNYAILACNLLMPRDMVMTDIKNLPDQGRFLFCVYLKEIVVDQCFSVIVLTPCKGLAHKEVTGNSIEVSHYLDIEFDRGRVSLINLMCLEEGRNWYDMPLHTKGVMVETRFYEYHMVSDTRKPLILEKEDVEDIANGTYYSNLITKSGHVEMYRKDIEEREFGGRFVEIVKITAKGNHIMDRIECTLYTTSKVPDCWKTPFRIVQCIESKNGDGEK